MLKYVALELGNGVLPGGKRLVSESNLLQRHERYATIAQDVHYGIGLVVDRTLGTPIVGHSGRIFGYPSEVLWLPEHGVGAVFLANADAGDVLAGAFQRYLLELLFDAEPKAQTEMTERDTALRTDLTDLLAQLVIPADQAVAATLAPHYESDSLGKLDVRRKGAATIFDFGRWKSEVASRTHEDGSVTFMTIAPGFDIFELVADQKQDGQRRLVLREAQHEYELVEVPWKPSP
jgi:hypothetical protein